MKAPDGEKGRRAMRMRDAIHTAFGALSANPLRTFLTMLGVMIGVGSIVSMAAIGDGAQARVAEQIRSFGANVLMINPGASTRGGVRSATATRHALTTEDARAIESLDLTPLAAPSVSGAAQVIGAGKNWATTVNGTTDAHFEIRGWRLKSGQFFSPESEKGAGKVAVIGAVVAEKIFGDSEPVGKTIRILDTPFTVIGVLAEKGTVGAGQSQDDVVFVPLRTAMNRLIGSANAVNRETVAYILTRARSDAAMSAAMRQVDLLLRQRHRIARGEENDFVVSSAAAMMAAQQASTRTVSILLGSIAAVSLIVGGISIMNIMLVSVTERTPEIGLRLAIGARPRDIRAQFLLEAAVLCVVGGIFGVLLGGGAAFAVARLAGWPILLQASTALAAVALAAAIGMFFGFYPAGKASRLQPVLALRAN